MLNLTALEEKLWLDAKTRHVEVALSLEKLSVLNLRTIPVSARPAPRLLTCGRWSLFVFRSGS